MTKALIEVQYLPSVSYFSCFYGVDVLVLEKHEHYVKQSYRNRCFINTSNGSEMLVVPITSKHGRPAIKDVKIDYSQKWLNRHWRAIQSSYGKAPFFEFYVQDLEEILFKKTVFLYDLNFELLSLCLEWLNLTIQVTESDFYENEPEPPTIDLRNKINAKKALKSTNSLNQLPYTQVFGSKFVSDLSLLDLIFCEGPNAKKYVESGYRQE